ncbi:hypothetical protein R5W23_004822 [Gemmata sp. JC673]|uniref:Uncharacterized protein n=1 Tax=Gemmata algarum TaxID=2975278 RepID=A0ABU5FBW8_9BACT|nr:hypothetical protein [Gemmata algarum]MDY3563321.1 hypothetical protein [Gemmata algarum]
MTPTRPEMIPVIQEVWRSRGAPGEAGHFIISEGFAKSNSYKARWWRKGEKERIETFRPEDDERSAQPAIKAFDGQFVRTVDQNPDKTIGSVRSVEGAGWNAMNRTHPFSFTHYYQNTPYSEIVERGAGFTATDADVGGKPGTRVFVHHPREDYRTRFVLLFDSNSQLVERRLITKLGRDKDFRVYEIHHFSDYAVIDNPTGDPVRMPMRVKQRSVCGEHPPGTFAEYWTEDVNVTRLVLNGDIPDKTFDLSIPAKAETYDGVGGHGWLAPGEQPGYLLSEDAKAKTRWLTWVGVALGALVILAGAVYARKRAGRAEATQV